VPGTERLIDFLSAVFDARVTRRFDNPDGSIMRAEMMLAVIARVPTIRAPSAARGPQHPGGGGGARSGRDRGAVPGRVAKPSAEGGLNLLAPAIAEDEEFRRRFVWESELAAAIDHPNIVPIYEAREAEELLFHRSAAETARGPARGGLANRLSRRCRDHNAP
jgi:hypothetical protein